MKIKKIEYKIVMGRWKNPSIAKEKGEFTYPILLTVIEDIAGNKVEVPLSYSQIAEMLEKHIWLEKVNDWDAFRRPYQNVVFSIIQDNMEKAKNTDAYLIREWFNNAKE